MAYTTRKQVEDAIAEISATLKGPGISNVERLLLHEDRKDLRKMLADMEAKCEGGAA